MKKGLSLLLALLMVVSVFSPALPSFGSIKAEAATAAAPDAYATVITASDFQDGRSGNAYEETFGTLIQKAKANGVNEPDGFILGGDYESSYTEDHDTPASYRRVESVITNAYPYFNRKNIVNIQGNHDMNDPSVIDKTGPHEFDDYIVYVINNTDYPAGTGGTSAYNKTLETRDNLAAYFNQLKAEGETRPIFIATHIPLHHNSRNPKANNKDAGGNVVSTGWNETLYGRILFELVNENAKIFDIVFLFGHNHSGAYDDYIGGSVNYKAKGETIRIADYSQVPSETSYTDETLNFTYMNYGYVGYTNNTSETTLTINSFEICPDRIVATRYSTAGQYGEANVIDRNMKTDSPSVVVDAYNTATVGSATGVVAIASGFTDPVFTWTSSNENVAKISGSDKVAKITFNAAGTTTIAVKAAERSNPYKTAIYRYDVTVSEDAGSTPGVSIYRAKEQVDNRTLEYYQTTLGKTVALSGCYYGLTGNASTGWTSSNTEVAKINQHGLVTFVGTGTTYITYTATDTVDGSRVEYTAQVKLIVSTEKKVEYKYVQTNTIVAGKSYVFATEYNGTTAIYSDRTTPHDSRTALSGTGTAFQGSSGSYYMLLDDQSFVWDAVKATSDTQVHLQNADSGLYLAAYKSAESSGNLGDFELTKIKPNNGIWQASDGVLQTTEGLKWYARSNGVCNVTNGTARTVYVFEQVPLEASANIEFTGEVVTNTTKTIYFALNGRQITLEGDYTNIQQLQSEAWTSSNPNVATIDQNGVVTFKGVQGETVITYTAIDAVNGNPVSASFTLSAVLTAEPTRLFKYTTTVVPGRKYLIANRTDDDGYGTVFSGYTVTTSKLLADRVDVIEDDGASYIEIPQHLTEVVWTPEAASGSSFYLKNEADGKYLYANSDGTYDSWGSLNGNMYTNSSYATNTEQYTWTYENGSKLYNQYAYTDTKLGDQTKTYVRSRSAEFPGVATESESKVYFYEEVASMPKSIITSRYEVLGEAVERTEICPFQTETLVPIAENFPDNSKVTFTWSSSNQTIAKIDQNGKITYTGKAGEVTITLTATSQVQDSTGAYPVDTTTVTINVIGGVGYVDPSQTVYTENAFYKTTELVPGRRYVMYAKHSDGTGLALSNVNKSSDFKRLLCTAIDAPKNDDNGEYVVTTDENIIWECRKSEVTGYYYLVNVTAAKGEQYMFAAKSSSNNTNGVLKNKDGSDHGEASALGDGASSITLLTYDSEYGMIRSKQLIDTGNPTYGIGTLAKSSSGYYYMNQLTYNSSSGRCPITLYAEPVAETDDPVLPDGDIYVHTESFVVGNKYIIADSIADGSTNTISNEYQNANTLLKVADATVSNSSVGEYIANPDADVAVFEAVASNVDGYVKLKAENGQFLVSIYKQDGTSVRYVLLADEGEYPEAHYLFQVGHSSSANSNNGAYYLKNNESTPGYTFVNGSKWYISSVPSNNVYLYALMERTEEPEEPEVPDVVTEIRKQDDFGSVNITRMMQYRYNVNNGDTEQILRYIRGVAFGYTTIWSVSDPTIATIDENGLLTYTGKTGYVDVMLTIIGEDFAGNDITRTLKTTFDVSAESNKTRVAVPETVYMAPVNGASTIGQVYVNNVMDPNNTYDVKTVAAREDDMYFGLRVVGAKSFTVNVSNATNPSNDINLCKADGSVVSETTSFNFNSDGVFENDGQYSLRFSGAGLNPGEKATAKWEITATMNDGSTKQTYTLYTVMYAPHRTVGAVAEARQVENSQNEISSWITGANGVDHSKWSPLGVLHADKSAVGYFKADPLYNQNPPTNSTGETPNDLINVVAEYPVENTRYENAYVMQAATNGNDDSTAKSYLGLLTVDKSRYTNTNQIPNLKIGYDALRRSGWTKDSFHTYSNYYTLGTSTSFTSDDPAATPGSDWVQERYFTNFAESHSIPERYTLIPSYNVTDIDGKYIHALNKGQCIQDFVLYVEREYSTAGTSVLCSVTDKGTLRNTVVSAYNITDGTTEFNEALKNAATVLGDPSATQPEIDRVNSELYDAMADRAATYYALKYDNLFSAFEYSLYPASMTVVSNSGTASYLNGTITVTNDTITGGEAYTSYGSADGYYHVDLKPNTEYVFEYDVTTSLNAQAFMFFYNSDNENADVPTNMSIKVNDGVWASKSESNSWWGNYTYGAGTYHYAIKFTTGPNTVKAGFRFGNTSNDPVTSTFSNIKLIDSAHYYEDVQYSKTEELYEAYTEYGSLATPVRPGYRFMGWKDANGSTITGANTATEHLTVYSQWKVNEYKLIFNGNGGAGSTTSATIGVNKPATLPSDFTRDNHTFLGWSYIPDASVADFNAGQSITAKDVVGHIDAYNQVTLYAVWERNYSVYYSQNEGTGTVAHTYNQLSKPHILPDDSTIERDGYEFAGWALTPDATTPDYYPGDEFYVGKIDPQYVNETKQEVILHAVWRKIGAQNVTFDNLVDISAWSDSVGSGTIVNDTDIGFTVESNADAGEATCSSAYFPVTEGHKYVVEADIKGDNWDIYFFFCDANGNWVDFSDSRNRLASNGLNQTTDGIHVTSTEFTAPAGAVKAQLRVDANGSNNAVRFENIRVNDTANRTYLETVNKVVEYGEAYGELPVPVKPGQTFLGWKDTNGNTVTAADLMESASTVYLTSAWTTDANSISNDTVVVEYGMPVVIDVRANDKSGNGVNAIGVASIADDALGHTSHPSSKFAGNSITLTNGNAVLNADGTITYTLDKTNVETEEVFYYEVQIDGNYYYAKVTVIPATTLYFEDTLFKFENATVTKNGVDYNYAWEVVGSSAGDEAQATDRPGPFNFEDDANNVYGYDSAKDGEAAFSGGSAHYTEVDKIAGAGGPTATFTFTGTGFDLFTVTDSKAGMFTATIYEGDKVDSTKRVKGVISNAYFGYDFDTELNDFVVANKGAIYQVPVLRERNLGYGTYTVVVQPRYNKSYDVANTGWSGVYVDSVRIFNPMGTDNTTANNAYKADGEYAPQYLEIRDTLVTPKLENGIYTGEYDFSVLENNKSVFLDGGKTSLADFAKLGPKNEVYLQAGDAVAFDIVTNSPVLPSTVQLGMGLTGNGGNTATVTLMNANYNGWKEDITLNSTAERYYNIESVVDWVLQSDGTYKTASPVIITNTSGGIIALTSLKWAFNQDIATTKLALIADEDTPVMARAAISRMLNPEPDNTVIAKENVAYSFSSESYAIGENGTLTISTEHGVAGVTVNGAEVVSCEAVENGKLNWTFEFTADVAGEVTYEIVVRDEAGNESEAIYAVTTVTDDSEATEPDDGIVDDGEDDDTTNNVGSDNLTPDSFVKNLLNGIMGILMRLFSLLLGGATV